MAYREVFRMEIQEIIRRWQAGMGRRHIAAGTGLSRNTVRRYLSAAKAEGIAQDGPEPTEEQLSRLIGHGPVGALRRPKAPQAGRVGVVARSDLPMAHRRPVADDPHPRVADLARGCALSYQSLRRFVHEAELATAQQDHGADGGHTARRGGRG